MALGLAEADAVDDRGVVERVGDDRVLLAEQRLEEAAVGVEARPVEDGVVGAEEAGDGLLQALVEVLRAADEAHAGEAEAVRVEGLLRGGEHRGVRGEAEVVVGAEVQHLLRRRRARLVSGAGMVRCRSHRQDSILQFGIGGTTVCRMD